MKILMAGNLQALRPGDKPFVDRLTGEFPQAAFVEGGDSEEQVGQIGDAEVYYGWLQREVFLAAKKLRWLHVPGTGIDQLTRIRELVESDVVVTNCRGPHANSMADHVMGMMVALAHRLPEQWADQQAHVWDTRKYDGRSVELTGKTMGILSLGDIGRAVARRAHGFGMEVYAVDKYPPDEPVPEVREVWGLDRLDELLGISDWFVVTAPLIPSTRGMIDRRGVGLLKQGARVIVISRGGLVNEDALLNALRSGGVAGAGIDAFAEEPLPADSPFWDLNNVIISPHASASTPDMLAGRQQIFRENLRRYVAGESLMNVCNKVEGF